MLESCVEKLRVFAGRRQVTAAMPAAGRVVDGRLIHLVALPGDRAHEEDNSFLHACSRRMLGCGHG
jgi:hypothetical protein